MMIVFLRIGCFPEADHFHESYLYHFLARTVVRRSRFVRNHCQRACGTGVSWYGVGPSDVHGLSASNFAPRV